MNPLEGMTPPASGADALLAACWQTQAELDRARAILERHIRRVDQMERQDPGQRLMPEARRAQARALDRMHAAERAAGAAADAYLTATEQETP